MLHPITEQEIAWTKSQSVVGDPSMFRLRGELRRAGLTPVELALTDDGEGLEFLLTRSAGLQELEREQMLRLVIAVLRRSGFEVGFSEVAIVDMTDEAVMGFSYVAPLQQIFDDGAPLIGP